MFNSRTATIKKYERPMRKKTERDSDIQLLNVSVRCGKAVRKRFFIPTYALHETFSSMFNHTKKS